MVPQSLYCRQGRCPTGFHKAGKSGSLPGPAIWHLVFSRPSTQILVKRPGREPGDFVGSTPISASGDLRTTTQSI